MFLPESLLFRVSVSIWWLKFLRIACSVAVGRCVKYFDPRSLT